MPVISLLNRLGRTMMTRYAEQIVLGIIQGITEWLPVSSEGMMLLAKTALFKSQDSFEAMISEALFLHAGSAAAAAIYFRKDIIRLFASLRKPSQERPSEHRLIRFLIISTLVSGALGLLLLKSVSQALTQNNPSTQIILMLIGACLMVTGVLQLIKKSSGTRTANDLTFKDSLLLGVAQALAALPGLSRSGMTVAALLFSRYTAPDAIRISFLMSIPIVLLGNFIMNVSGHHFHAEHLAGLAFSFLFSILTIHILIRAAEKINFGLFVLVMGIITLAAAFLPAL